MRAWTWRLGVHSRATSLVRTCTPPELSCESQVICALRVYAPQRPHTSRPAGPRVNLRRHLRRHRASNRAASICYCCR
eukprot:4193533-Prymnesium_polylepis.2